MHIPDGFLSNNVMISTDVISAVIVYISAKKNSYSNEQRIPLLGMAAVWVFSCQLLAFPVPFGTSVHLNGVGIIAVMLGFWSANLISFVSILLSAILFQHGGLFSIGANFINMGLIPAFFSTYLWKLKPKSTSFFFIAPLVNLAGAFACSFELSISGHFSFKTGIIPMGISHLIVGIIEGIVYSFLFSNLMRLKPEIILKEKI